MVVLRNDFREARKYYKCDNCSAFIRPGEYYQHLFGGKEVYGKMTVLRLCIGCKYEEKDNKDE